MKLSFQQVLAGIGMLCIVATFLSSILLPDGLKSSHDPKFISVVELAEKIKEREKITIVDLRSSADYKQFHIPTAINVSLTDFNATEWTGQELIVYSGDDNLSRKFWSDLPKSIKSTTSIVYGGVHDWYDRVLYPSLPLKTNPEDSLLVEKINLLSLFYGGLPEYSTENTVEYYRQNFSQLQWPVVERKGTLVRKGC